MLEPEFKEFARDQVLMAEGSVGDQIYLLVDGQARVNVRGVSVGRILQNEIFGAQSAITNSPRNATVICDADRCFVMSITKEQFRELIREKPETAEVLIENLVRVINELNEKVIQLQNPAASKS